MAKKLKILFFIFLAGTFFYFGGKAAEYLMGVENENARLHTELIGQKEAFKQLTKHTAQLESRYTAQAELAKQAKKRFAEVVKTKDERIKLLSDATYLIGRHITKQNGPDYYFETPRATRNYLINELRIQGDDSPAIGYILIKHDGRTYKRNYKFEVKVETLQTVDEDTGRIKVYSKAFLVSKEKSPLAKRVKGYKDWKDIEYPLAITGGTAIVDPTIRNQLKPKMHWWAPHLNANINLAGGDPASGLGVSLMGYGPVKNDLSFRFMQFGAHYNDELGVQGTFTPVLWRPLPSLLSNTYLGPGMTLKNSGVGYFLGVQIGL